MHSLIRLGLAAGFGLLVLPVLVVAIAGSRELGNPAVIYVLGAETVLIAATQVAISYVAIRRTPTPGVVGALLPAVIAGIVVTPGDVAAASLAFGTPASAEIVSTVVAYDVVFGVMMAVPVLFVARATSLCRVAARKADVDASARGLDRASTDVFSRKARARLRACAHACCTFARCSPISSLLRHIRRTLEAAQRGYAKRTVDTGLNKAQARDRQGDRRLSPVGPSDLEASSLSRPSQPSSFCGSSCLCSSHLAARCSQPGSTAALETGRRVPST